MSLFSDLKKWRAAKVKAKNEAWLKGRQLSRPTPPAFKTHSGKVTMADTWDTYTLSRLVHSASLPVGYSSTHIFPDDNITEVDGQLKEIQRRIDQLTRQAHRGITVQL